MVRAWFLSVFLRGKLLKRSLICEVLTLSSLTIVYSTQFIVSIALTFKVMKRFIN